MMKRDRLENTPRRGCCDLKSNPGSEEQLDGRSNLGASCITLEEEDAKSVVWGKH
jgi:hypothetical protein